MARRVLKKSQKAWIQKYEDLFGMDAMYVEDYLKGDATWKEFCVMNYNWLESWLHESIRTLERLERLEK